MRLSIIRCDLCGLIHELTPEYQHLNFTKVKMTAGDEVEMDLCKKCYRLYKGKKV